MAPVRTTWGASVNGERAETAGGQLVRTSSDCFQSLSHALQVFLLQRADRGAARALDLIAGATWLSLRDDEDDPARGEGPEPTFGFGEPPASEGLWEEPGC